MIKTKILFTLFFVTKSVKNCSLEKITAEIIEKLSALGFRRLEMLFVFLSIHGLKMFSMPKGALDSIITSHLSVC